VEAVPFREAAVVPCLAVAAVESFAGSGRSGPTARDANPDRIRPRLSDRVAARRRPFSLRPNASAAATPRRALRIPTAAATLPTELVVHADPDQAFRESDRAV
jgi:hypothetical protein